MQIVVGVTLIGLAVGVAYLRVKQRSFALQAIALLVAIAGGIIFNSLDRGSDSNVVVIIVYTALAVATAALMVRAAVAARG